MGGGGFAQAGTPPLSFRFFLKCKSEAIDLAQGETIVSFQHVSMQFPGVLANHDVTLDIRKGEVFALVGENGAGKSTLMNILYGLNTPTSGKVLVKGNQVTHFSPSEAIARGVDIGAMDFIHQQIMQKRNAGCAILLVSADLDELLRLSDRLLTIYEGRITGEFQAGDIDKREISYYMTGGRKEEQA